MNRMIRIAFSVAWLFPAMIVLPAQAQQSRLFDTPDGIAIDVIDARPVAVALQLISNEFPIDLTYEDARFTFDGDLEDITLQVRTDLHLYAEPSEVPRVIVPSRTKQLSVHIPIEGALNSREASISAIEAVISAQNLAGSGGKYRIERSSDAVHIVPAEVRNEIGVFTPQTYLLSTRITIPAQELSGLGMISKICEAVSLAVSGTYSTEPDNSILENVLKPRRVPMGTLGRYRGVLEANNEPVRDVLLRMLRAISDRAAWQVFVEFDPIYQNYWISVRALPLDVGLPEPNDGRSPEEVQDRNASPEGGFLIRRDLR